MNKLIIFLTILSNAYCIGQKVIKDTILVNTSINSQIILNGEIIKLDMSNNLALLQDPLLNKGKSIITLAAEKEFNDYEYINIINDKNEYFLIAVKYQKKIANPFFFIEKKELTEMQNNKNNLILNKIIDKANKINLKNKEELQRLFCNENNLLIKLVNVLSCDDVIYLRLAIENLSAYTFYNEGINFKISEYDSYKKTTSPEEIITPIYYTGEKEISVKPREKKYITYAFNAFKIPKNRILKIGILEKYSTKEYSIDINAKYINNPKKWEE